MHVGYLRASHSFFCFRTGGYSAALLTAVWPPPLPALFSEPLSWLERAHSLGNQTTSNKPSVEHQCRSCTCSNSPLFWDMFFQILVFLKYVFKLLLLPSSQTWKYTVKDSPGIFPWPLKLNGGHSDIPHGGMAHFGLISNGEKRDFSFIKNFKSFKSLFIYARRCFEEASVSKCFRNFSLREPLILPMYHADSVTVISQRKLR